MKRSRRTLKTNQNRKWKDRNRRLATENLEERQLLASDVACATGPCIELDKFVWTVDHDPYDVDHAHVGEEVFYGFKVTNSGNSNLYNVALDDGLPGFVKDPDILVKYTAVDQPPTIPVDGNLGPFASVDRTIDPKGDTGADPFEAKAWDNFSIPSYTVLESVAWAGAYIEPFATGDGAKTPETDFLIEFFTDSSGTPGALHSSVVIPGGDAGVSDAAVKTTLLGHSAEFGGPAYAYEANIPFVEFNTGEYWISITALQTFPSEKDAFGIPNYDPTWQWHLGSGAGDGFYSYDDTFDDAGDNEVGDANESPSPVVHHADKDLAFKLKAARRATFDGHLHPGEMIFFIGSYYPTDDDAAVGKVENKATVTADDGSTTVMDMDTEVIRIEGDPKSSIEIDKYLWDINGLPDLTVDIKEGDELWYAFDVTNTGDTKLSGVDVSDGIPGFVMDADVVVPYIAHDQPLFIPTDNNLGPYATVDRKEDPMGNTGADQYEAKAWDNFSLSEATIIDRLEWVGAYVEPFAETTKPEHLPKTDFLVEIFSDSSGTPGGPLHSFKLNGGLAGVSDANVSTTLLGHTAEFMGPVYAYDAMLPFTVIPAGDYWLSITALQTFPNPVDVDPEWQWHLGSGAGDGFYTFDDTFDDAGDLGVGKENTSPRPANKQDKDLAFTLHASRQVSFNGMLLPGETVMFMGRYIVTADDVANGEIVNKGTVTAHDPSGTAVMDMDTETIKVGGKPPKPPITIDKYLWDINGSPDLHHDIKVGDELIYSFDVSNTGTEKISHVVLTDSLPGFVLDPEVAVPFIAHHQPHRVPASGDVGVYSSTDRTLADDTEETQAWDNFSLSEHTVVEGLSWAGAYDFPFVDGAMPETDFLIEIYKDNAGAPDEVVLSYTAKGGKAGVDDKNVDTAKFAHTTPDSGPAFGYHTMLPFTGLDAGDYWISIVAEQTFPSPVAEDPIWQWHLGSGPGDGFLSFDEIFDTAPISFADKDLAFTLHAAELEPFDGMLDPGESVMFMGTYTVTKEDVMAGGVDNTGTVTGKLPGGMTVSDSDDFFVKINKPKHFADINMNGEVDFGDFLILSENFGKMGGFMDGDIDGDGKVGFADFLILSEHFGETAWAKAVDEALA